MSFFVSFFIEWEIGDCFIDGSFIGIRVMGGRIFHLTRFTLLKDYGVWFLL